MKRELMTEDEMQYQEHCVHKLEDNARRIEEALSKVRALMKDYMVDLDQFVHQITQAQHSFGLAVSHIAKNARELRVATSGVQELVAFANAASNLDKVLSEPLTKKIIDIMIINRMERKPDESK